MARTGRRPGASGTREAILDAAREVLAREGYDRATIRGIARRAKVDPALVLHYFHSKEALFVHAMQMPINPAELMRGMLREGHAGLGRRVVETVLRIWGDRRNAETLVGFFRSTMSNARATAMFRQWLSRAMLGSVRRSLATPDAELRAALVSSQIVGLIVTRHILRLKPLTQAGPEVLVDWIGPTIQRYLTGDGRSYGPKVGPLGKASDRNDQHGFLAAGRLGGATPRGGVMPSARGRRRT